MKRDERVLGRWNSVITGSSPDGAAANLATELQPEVGGNTARNQKRNLGQMQDLAQGLASYSIIVDRP
jgi:hypothetical protein